MKMILGAVGALILVGGGLWWLLREPPLQPGELRVTYDHGELCLWQDWTFRVRRQSANTRVMGNTLSMSGHNVEKKDDTTLRVYSPSGEKLFIQSQELRELQFVTRPDSDNPAENTVVSLALVTDSETIGFSPVELPKYSRSRVMVPVASHYFPDQSDDYMTWGNVRLTLAGTVDPDCSIDREISLTRPDHSKKRTPVLIEFGH